MRSCNSLSGVLFIKAIIRNSKFIGQASLHSNIPKFINPATTEPKTPFLLRTFLEMNLVRSNHNRSVSLSTLLRTLYYSTETQTCSFSQNDTLFRRICRLTNPRVSVPEVINQWVEEGRRDDQSFLRSLIKQLRHFKRSRDALQVSEWMSSEMNSRLSPADIAVCLDLISKVRGLEAAEKYFHEVPQDIKGMQVYGALLSCYAHCQSVEKAEALMQSLIELGFAKNSLSYNVMLKLYSKTKNYEKMDLLMEEMKDRGIEWDNYTYATRLNAYASISDLDGLEKLLMKMEADPNVIMDWHAYVAAANGYLKAGLVDKVHSSLKQAEQLSGANWSDAYNHIVTLYSATGNKDEVYHIWEMYKSKGTILNLGYIAIISSLLKLDDVNGAERIFHEWLHGKNAPDSRIPKMIITAYCKNGLLDKAEECIKLLLQFGKDPGSRGWDSLAQGYHDGSQMDKALESMKKAIEASSSGWRPNHSTLTACLDHLKSKGDVELAEDLLKSLKEKGHLPDNLHKKFENYIHDKESGSTAIEKMEGAVFSLSENVHNLEFDEKACERHL